MVAAGTLSEGEVEWVEKALEAAKTNVFKNLTRDIFEVRSATVKAARRREAWLGAAADAMAVCMRASQTLDVNSDATLAPDELEAAVESGVDPCTHSLTRALP